MVRVPVTALDRSKLENQNELLTTDLSTDGIKLAYRGSASFDLGPYITKGSITRTIDGASMLKLTVNDEKRIIRNSRKLGANVDTYVDGLWFRLVKVSKNKNNLDLIFEPREVAILRTYNGKRVAGWNKTTRLKFARSLVQEVKEFQIPFVCPELKDPIVPKSDQDRPDAAAKKYNREFGFGARTKGEAWQKQNDPNRLLIKGKAASKNQLENVEAVLDVGTSMLLRRKILVCAIMTIIVESSAINLPFGDRDSVGLFQQRPSQGWPASLDIAKDSKAFYDKAVAYDRSHPNIPYGELCQAVQISAFPDRYEQHRAEAERLVTAYGVSGNDIARADNLAEDLMMTEWGSQIEDYQFTRGQPKTLPGGRTGWKKEDTWSCLRRLAEEVDWRCFEVSGSIYFISEPRLFASASRARISEDSEGVDWIDFDYDTGKRNATCKVTCRLDRWVAPPGTCIEIFDNGPVNGKWLVTEIERDLHSPNASITLKKPRPKLPEPTQDDDLTGLWDNPVTGNPQQTQDLLMGPDVIGSKRPGATLLAQPVVGYSAAAEATHMTSGLGWPAVDIMCDPASLVVAPESGTIYRTSGHPPALYDPSTSVMGYSLYLRGISGSEYFLTHMASTAKEGSEVVAGEVIGVIAEWPGDTPRTHLHFAIKPGSPVTFRDISRLRPLS